MVELTISSERPMPAGRGWKKKLIGAVGRHVTPLVLQITKKSPSPLENARKDYGEKPHRS